MEIPILCEHCHQPIKQGEGRCYYRGFTYHLACMYEYLVLHYRRDGHENLRDR